MGDSRICATLDPMTTYSAVDDVAVLHLSLLVSKVKDVRAPKRQPEQLSVVARL